MKPYPFSAIVGHDQLRLALLLCAVRPEIGGALIRGIDKLLSEKTGLPVTVSEDPLSAVANGTGAVLNDLSWLMQNV